MNSDEYQLSIIMIIPAVALKFAQDVLTFEINWIAEMLAAPVRNSTFDIENHKIQIDETFSNETNQNLR